MGTRKWLAVSVVLLLLASASWFIWKKFNSHIAWRKTYQYRVHDVATLGDHVYVLRSDNSTGNGNLLECLDLSGKLLWDQDLAKLTPSDSVDYDLALAWHGMIYLGGGKQPDVIAVDASGLRHVVSVPDGVWHLIPSGDELYSVTPYSFADNDFSGAKVFDHNLNLIRGLEFNGQGQALDVNDSGYLAFISLELGDLQDRNDDHQDLVCLDRDGNELFRHTGDYNGYGNVVHVGNTYVACMSMDGFEVFDFTGMQLVNEGGPLDDLFCSFNDNGRYFGISTASPLRFQVWNESGVAIWNRACREDYFSFSLGAKDYILSIETDIVGHTRDSYMALPNEVRSADILSSPGDPEHIARRSYMYCWNDSGRLIWRTGFPEGYIYRRRVEYNDNGMLFVPGKLYDGSDTQFVYAIRVP